LKSKSRHFFVSLNLFIAWIWLEVVGRLEEFMIASFWMILTIGQNQQLLRITKSSTFVNGRVAC